MRFTKRLGSGCVWPYGAGRLLPGLRFRAEMCFAKCMAAGHPLRKELGLVTFRQSYRRLPEGIGPGRVPPRHLDVGRLPEVLDLVAFRQRSRTLFPGGWSASSFAKGTGARCVSVSGGVLRRELRLVVGRIPQRYRLIATERRFAKGVGSSRAPPGDLAVTPKEFGRGVFVSF